MEEYYDQFRELGAEIIAVSTDSAEDAESIIRDNQLTFPVAYDTDTEVTSDWGVFDLLGDGVATPSTFIFDGRGEMIAWRVGKGIGDRPTAPEILKVLSESVTKSAGGLTGIEIATMKIGQEVHDFTLPTAYGQDIKLSSYFGEKNVVILFYRAWW